MITQSDLYRWEAIVHKCNYDVLGVPVPALARWLRLHCALDNPTSLRVAEILRNRELTRVRIDAEHERYTEAVEEQRLLRGY